MLNCNSLALWRFLTVVDYASVPATVIACPRCIAVFYGLHCMTVAVCVFVRTPLRSDVHSGSEGSPCHGHAADAIVAAPQQTALLDLQPVRAPQESLRVFATALNPDCYLHFACFLPRHDPGNEQLELPFTFTRLIQSEVLWIVQFTNVKYHTLTCHTQSFCDLMAACTRYCGQS